MDINNVLKLKLFNRDKIETILEWLDDERIILITGSRQVGKTSILYLIIQKLYQQGKQDLVYFDLEDFDILQTFNNGVRDFIQLLKYKGFEPGRRVYVLIDEIQYLDDPSNFLKLIADHYKNIKVIASGSSTLDIKRKFKDSLVGRKIVFEIDTLRFPEYLVFRQKSELINIVNRFKIRDMLDNKTIKISKILDIVKEELRKEFDNYITYGGYPAVVKEDNISKKIDIIYDIYSSYVRKDINQIFSIEKISVFNALVKMLAVQIGSLVNEQHLANNLKTNYITLQKYIFVLENTFIIKLLKPYFTNRQREIVKMPKVYFLDMGLRNTVIKSFSELTSRTDLGFVIENYLFGMLNTVMKSNEEIKYWRTKNGVEVDFIIETDKLIPIECKYHEMKTPNIPRGLRVFAEKYSPEFAVTITRDYLGVVKKVNTNYYFIPACMLG